MGIEIGIVSNMDHRNLYLPLLARIKQRIAKAERTIAHYRAKEMMILHRIYSIGECVAEKRIMQADINVERTRLYQQESQDRARPVAPPEDILVALSRPTGRNMDGLGVI